jgi:integrase
MACVRKRRGKYVLDFYDQYGVRHWETIGTNKKEADDKLAERRLEIKGNNFISSKDRNIPFSALGEQWLAGREGKIRPSTIAQYDDHLQKHLLPFFGPVKIGQIDIPRVDAYVARKQKDMAELARRKADLTDRATKFDEGIKADGR